MGLGDAPACEVGVRLAQAACCCRRPIIGFACGRPEARALSWRVGWATGLARCSGLLCRIGGAGQATPEEVDLVTGEPVDALGVEALEVVEVVSLELGTWSARGCLLDCRKRDGAVAFAERPRACGRAPWLLGRILRADGACAWRTAEAVQPVVAGARDPVERDQIPWRCVNDRSQRSGTPVGEMPRGGRACPWTSPPRHPP